MLLGNERSLLLSFLLNEKPKRAKKLAEHFRKMGLTLMKCNLVVRAIAFSEVNAIAKRFFSFSWR
ncbi:hypothetical protein [Coleofasciculus sp. FACHB-129]|uniref:hypothetical protein n=1 Tax=Cyanophyceae TaxID=3028117 RepID=UPI0016899C70|nr:hypothetical protein [Coleofasciculus sp. FACHB-129]MBD1895458.1 hypothetical protein [Coleofasciculus sp. FACHB-129]